MQLARRFLADESGATAIEYALIAAGIGAAIAATVFSIGYASSRPRWWDKIGNVDVTRLACLYSSVLVAIAA